MDSGDHSKNQLTAFDTKFGVVRNHSFSNLFQGFFGVKPKTGSLCDIPSMESTTKVSEESSAGPVLSPSNDDSWILSHLLFGKHELEGDGNLRKNVTWSELGKFEHLLSGRSSSASSTTDIPRRIDNEPPSRADISGLAVDGFEEFEKSNSSVAKNTEHYLNTSFSSFPMQDVSVGALKPREDWSGLEQTGSMDQHESRDSPPGRDQVDQSCLPLIVTSSEKPTESRHTLRDLLWNFNHEKINVSRKEMNLIASIDQ